MENEQNITPSSQADELRADVSCADVSRETSASAAAETPIDSAEASADSAEARFALAGAEPSAEAAEDAVAPSVAAEAPETPGPSEAPDDRSRAAAARPAFDVILASASPRRRELLAQAGVAFSVRASDVDESLDADLLADPPEAAKKLAERKAGAVVQEVLAESYTGTAMILGADTMVVCEGEVFGKPRSLSDAKRMLRRLSGRTHEVVTAVSVWMVAAPEAENLSIGFRTFADVSAVTFRELTDDEIVDYLRKGESFDKAGAYAVQGAGADLVERVDGSLDTVIGLPVGRLLREFPDLAGSA